MKSVIHIVCVTVVVVALNAPTVLADVGYLDEGSIVSWGRDDYGQIGDTPTGINFTAVAASSSHSLALKADGSLVAWGSDYSSVAPVGTGFSAVVAGGAYGLALKADGSLVTWGSDNWGAVSGTPSGTGFVAVAAGNHHGLAVRTDGSLAAWGYDRRGQVSDMPTGTGFAAVAAGGNRSLALKTDGALVSWGSGINDVVSASARFTAIGAGSGHSLAVKTDGSLVAWGYDDQGQVSGMPGGIGFVAVAGGDDHSLAVKADGSLVSWGYDFYGQVSDTPVSGYYVDISAGSNHSVALKAHQEYEDLLVTGAGARALLQRDVSVSGDCTLDTMLNGKYAPRLTVAGALVLQPGADFSGAAEIDAEAIELNGVQVSASLGEVFGLENHDRVSGHGVIAIEFHGASSSSITVSGGTLTAGDPSSYSGFSTDGKLHVGADTAVLHTKGFAPLGSETTIAGGAVVAVNGAALAAGDNVVGYGEIRGPIAAGFGSTIVAEGQLSLGDGNAYHGFFSDGSLITGANTVTINDRNQAVVGSLTQLGDAAADGALIAANGLLVEFGKNVVGRGTVDTPNDPLAPLTNNGDIVGDFPGAIVLTGYVEGIGTLDNVTVTGTLSPGLSTTRLYVGNLDIGAAGELLMELGGPAVGSGHDQIFSTGVLSLGGALAIELIGQFDPQLGNEFDLFDGAISGEFATFDLPGLPSGLTWDTNSLYTDGTISVTPEPATMVILALGGLAVIRRRRRK
jgi:hypothetical protein